MHLVQMPKSGIAVSEKTTAPHSNTLAWKIPWMEEPGRLQSMGSRRVRHDWATSLSLFTFMHWRRKWQPTPVFLPGESQGWGHTESDTTEVTQQQQQHNKCMFDFIRNHQIFHSNRTILHSHQENSCYSTSSPALVELQRFQFAFI